MKYISCVNYGEIYSHQQKPDTFCIDGVISVNLKVCLAGEISLDKTNLVIKENWLGTNIWLEPLFCVQQFHRKKCIRFVNSRKFRIGYLHNQVTENFAFRLRICAGSNLLMGSSENKLNSLHVNISRKSGSNVAGVKPLGLKEKSDLTWSGRCIAIAS